MKRWKRKRFLALLAGILLLAQISGCKAGDKKDREEQMAVIDDYGEIMLLQDEDSARFDHALESVKVYVEEPGPEHREEARKVLEEAIGQMEEDRESGVPYELPKELGQLLENQGISGAEYKINADTRYQYLDGYLEDLGHLLLYIDYSEANEEFMEDLEFSYSCIAEHQKQARAFNYTGVNYWFAPWEGQEAYVKEQVLDRFVSFKAEDFHWEKSREEVENRMNLYLDRIEQLMGEWSSYIWHSKEKLYEEMQQPDEEILDGGETAEANTSGFAFLQAVKENEDGNKMVSKASLDALLRLAALGTSDRDLKERICAYTGINGGDDIAGRIKALEAANDQNVLKSAYGIWADKSCGLQEGFRKELEGLNARTEEFDQDKKADAVRQINQYVDENTGHMIPSVIDSPAGLGDLFLVNTLYFDGKWKEPFDANDTFTDNFTRKNGEKMDAEFMYEEGSFYYEDDRFLAYAKDYQGGIYDFIAIMPRDEGALDYDVSEIDLDSLLKNRKHREKVEIFLPKFEFDWMDENLKSVLEKAGLGDMFTEGKFDRMLREPCVAVSVLQKTRVEVDESGTKAAAATGMNMMCLAAPMYEEPVRIWFNRPFVFVIRNKKTNEHMFTGLVNHPEKK